MANGATSDLRFLGVSRWLILVQQVPSQGIPERQRPHEIHHPPPHGIGRRRGHLRSVRGHQACHLLDSLLRRPPTIWSESVQPLWAGHAGAATSRGARLQLPLVWLAPRMAGLRGVGAQRSEGPEGWKPKPRKREGPKGWGPKGGARRWGAQHFAFFCFPLPLPFWLYSGGLLVSFFSLSGVFSCLFFSLWGSSRGIVVVFWIPAPSNVHVWESPQTPREKKKAKMGKSAKFWAVRGGGSCGGRSCRGRPGGDTHHTHAQNTQHTHTQHNTHSHNNTHTRTKHTTHTHTTKHTHTTHTQRTHLKKLAQVELGFSGIGLSRNRPK